MANKKETKKKRNKNQFVSNMDPYGAYTGNDLFGGIPVQDADDL